MERYMIGGALRCTGAVVDMTRRRAVGSWEWRGGEEALPPHRCPYRAGGRPDKM